MPRSNKGARLWLRPARRKGGRLIARAVWIIVDGGRHIATGCLKDQAGEAEKLLAAYITDKYRPSRLVKDIGQIDIADVLSIYFDDCGPRMADQPKLERCISRLNDYWGGKVLSEVTAAECRAYAHSRGKTGGTRTDLETLRAAINHHAKENLHYGTVRVSLPPKGPPRDRWLTRGEAAKLIWACWRYRETTNRAPRSEKGAANPNGEASAPSSCSVHPDRAVYGHAGQRHRLSFAVPRHGTLVRRPRPRDLLQAGDWQASNHQAANSGTDTATAAGPYAAVGPARHRDVAFRRMAGRAG